LFRALGVAARRLCPSLFFFCTAPVTTDIYTLSLHDALPLSPWDVSGSSSSPWTLCGPGTSHFSHEKFGVSRVADTTTRVFSAKKDGQALFFPGLVPSRYSIISEYIANDPYARHRFTELSEILGYSLVEAYREADIYDWEVYELGHSAV